MIPEFTVVLGVDYNHLDHLKTVMPNWAEHRAGTFLHRPMVVFYDSQDTRLSAGAVAAVVPAHANIVPWPGNGAIFDPDLSAGRFGVAQRYKMLAGFVHVPPKIVSTPYWLKLDLDVVATGGEDWILPEWFENNPAIIAPGWGYTKPPDQMLRLDAWADKWAFVVSRLRDTEPLNLRPEPGSSVVRHKRIISWCSFFNTDFSKICSKLAERTCGGCRLPVTSQDGYMWYLATRFGYNVRRVPMKDHGWRHCPNIRVVKEVLERM